MKLKLVMTPEAMESVKERTGQDPRELGMKEISLEDAQKARMVVCVRVDDKFVRPLPKSYQDKCAVCGVGVWVDVQSPVGPPKWCWKCYATREPEKFAELVGMVQQGNIEEA